MPDADASPPLASPDANTGATTDTTSERPAVNYVIETIDLVKEYDNGQITALKKVNLRIKPREFLAIVGPSGSGKSTLLHLLGTLDNPTSGTVKIMGHDISQVRALNILRAETIGFIFQLHNLIPSLNLLDNVMVPLAPLPIPSAEKRRRAERALEDVGLAHRMTHQPTKVSGGERQRAAFARALVNEPDIILGDEPTGNVDSKTGTRLMDLLLGIKDKRGTTLVIVTHDPSIARMADRCVSIKDGELAEADPNSFALF